MKRSERKMTVALLFHRALEMGLTYSEAFNEDIGFIQDLITEKLNDSHEYAEVGSAADFKAL